MTVLFIGPLPEPITGQALACRIFLDELSKYHRVEIIDISKRQFRHGLSSFSRIFEVLRILLDTRRKQHLADAIYFTPSESFAGNVKDLLIYLTCFRRLPQMVMHLHGGAGMRGILLQPHPLRLANEFFLRRVGAAIVLGERLADIYDRVLPRERIHLVPNCAEDYLFADGASIDKKFSNVKPLHLLFLSNLLPGKGHIELVDAFLALDAVVREAVVLDLAGGFETDTQRRNFLARIAGVPQIRYHGTVRGDLRKSLFHQAHVFCLPTYYPYEGQPLSILEAYASGCAVITTDHSGIFDTFTPEVNGFQVAKRSSADLAAAIRRTVEHPEQLRAMAHANLQTAELRYRASHYNAAMMRVINSVAGASNTHSERGVNR